MKLSLIKEIKTFCSTDIALDEWREVIEQMSEGTSDFEVENYRFIDADNIDAIQQGELENDLYVLGCFNAPFLSGILDIDYDVIKSMQSAEAFEAVGKLIISLGKLEELQEQYSSLDGYGHHFAHYDHHEHEINGYYCFRIN